MILEEYQAAAWAAIDGLGGTSRTDLVGHLNLGLLLADTELDSSWNAVGDLLDSLRQLLIEAGPDAPTAAWLPILVYLAALRNTYADEDPDTQKALLAAVGELHAYAANSRP